MIYVLLVISATVRVLVGDAPAPALLEAHRFASLSACETERGAALARYEPGAALAECVLIPTGN